MCHHLDCQIGNGTTTNKSTPTQVNGICNVSVISVKENYIENNISIYPNPSKEKISIELNSLYTTQEIYDYTAVLYNINGEHIKNILIHSNKTTIQLDDLVNGVYYIKIISKYGSTIKKIIKS